MARDKSRVKAMSPIQTAASCGKLRHVTGDGDAPGDFEPQSIGEMIRAARAKMGLSQPELALRVGTSRRTVMRWENGQTHPGPKYAPKLVAVLCVDLTPLDHPLAGRPRMTMERRVAAIEAALVLVNNEISQIDETLRAAGLSPGC